MFDSSKVQQQILGNVLSKSIFSKKHPETVDKNPLVGDFQHLRFQEATTVALLHIATASWDELEELGPDRWASDRLVLADGTRDSVLQGWAKNPLTLFILCFAEV